MANLTLAQIRLQLDQVASEYDARFAGQSRVSRDLNDLNSLVRRTQQLLQDLEKLPKSKDRAEVEQAARDAINLYDAERKEIMKARSLGPGFEEFSTLRGEANFIFSKYHRHFSGKARNTRDLGLLAEMIADLETVGESMNELAPELKGQPGVQDDLTLVADNLKMYRAEQSEIIEARAMGTDDEQASALAEVANGQFNLYEAHFAGKSRATRRPELLQRMIDNLTETLERMKALRTKGLRVEYNEKNIEIVEQSLGTYRSELTEIRKARQTTKITDLQGMLGGAANEVFEAYRKAFAGQDRRTRDLDLLTTICDQLGEIGKQMASLGAFEPTDQNSKNLQIVTDQRVLFEREYTMIEEARAQGIH
ncbi:MAG: hypothetical protein IPN17_02390 [Deltaproteobacteria bacterium]|nr:hypothetical protein [Deltaproteobacteria bacterium]